MHGFDAAATRALSGFSPRLAFGCRFGAAGLKSIARNFNAACLRCMDLSRQPPGRCPLFHRGLASVVAPARPDRKLLPETSPRLAFGCRFGAAGLKLVARNFNAAFLRCMDLTRQTPGHCPFFHRALLSVVAPARPDRKLLLETSPRLTFGCRSGAAGQKIVVRFFTATCFRLSAMRSRTENHCPKFLRGRHRLNIIQPCGRKFIFLLFLFRFAFNNQ